MRKKSATQQSLRLDGRTDEGPLVLLRAIPLHTAFILDIDAAQAKHILNETESKTMQTLMASRINYYAQEMANGRWVSAVDTDNIVFHRDTDGALRVINGHLRLNAVAKSGTRQRFCAVVTNSTDTFLLDTGCVYTPNNFFPGTKRRTKP